MTRPRIGLLGGTFDPIHIGHLALARSALDAFNLDEVRLMPSGQSWQKNASAASSEQRLQMVQLAISGQSRLLADGRETRRPGASYTIDTLVELRGELGDQTSIVLLLGSDQLRNLASWYRYRELLNYAHIACTQREQVSLQRLPAEVDQLLQAHGQDAPDTPAGAIVLFVMPPVPVSATALRERLAAGERPAELVPAKVLDYIDSHRLYLPQATH
ncbi:MAG: nicotinate-nucleotide adenylyltransferase [Quisquiliibacterium sp.]